VFGHVDEEPPPQSQVGTLGTVHTAVADPGGEQGRGGAPEGLILLLFTILTIAASAYVLLSSESDAKKDPAQKAARGEIKGLAPESLLREANLRRALAKVADGPRPLISSIRVSATRLDLTVRDANGSRQLVHVDPALATTTNDFGVGDDASVRVSGIDASAPERMVRAVAERTHMSPDAVDYVTLSSFGSTQPIWYMALDQGPVQVRQWVAEPDGTDLRKPGELSQKQKDANAKVQRDARARNRKLQRTFRRRNACLQKATDATAAARCIQRNPL
jgi:hypothetical protein